jgi:hypothetical protein
MRKAHVAAAAASLALGSIALGAPAPATAGGVEVSAGGSCSGSAEWKLKAKFDDGRIEWEFEVDSNRNGQVWRVRVRDNGHQVMSGKRRTHGPSGSFEVERKTANRSGKDHFVARAQRGKNGQVCVGRVSI